MMIDYALILSAKYPGTKWVLNGDEYAGLDWLDETSKPTKAVLDKLWPVVCEEIEKEKAAKEATRNALLERLGITAEEAKLLLS